MATAGSCVLVLDAHGRNKRIRVAALEAETTKRHEDVFLGPEIQPNKIVVLSGAGLSAESGLPTFRDSNGL